ncbi:unnamed protein product [Symbiodinium sp. CCMP2592]|nr:unnamed protein product [Symbiodinium sp. CCMP2592]
MERKTLGEVLMPKAWLQPLVAALFDASSEHASDAAQFLFPHKEISILQLPGPNRVAKTCFDAHMQAELDPRDEASRMAAEAEQAHTQSSDPDAVAREEQHLPKEAIPSRQDCPEIHCEKCAECPSCPTCPSCPHGFRHPEGDEGTPPPVAGKVVCNRMENNCPFCPACQCPECPKKCQPCLNGSARGSRIRAALHCVGSGPYEQLLGPSELSQADVECVTRRQLLLPPGSDWELERHRMRAGHRCRHGWPQVLVMDPLRSSGKIGDLMRLTCPLLVSAIDDYEVVAIEAYNKRVKHDDDWLSQLLATHEAHRSLRQSFMSEHENKLLEARKIMGNQTVDVIMSAGLANVKFSVNSTDVKCLHAQVADLLSRGSNVIGRQVLIDLTEMGVQVEATTKCCDFCNVSKPLDQSQWTFGHAKNKVPNDPPTVKLDANGQVQAADGSPVNPLVQAINDDVKEHASGVGGYLGCDDLFMDQGGERWSLAWFLSW